MRTDPRQYGRDRQRLAWTILLVSFAICIVMTIAVPLTVNAYLQNATEPLKVTVQSNKGTVGIDDETNVRQAIVIGQSGLDILAGSGILTDATAQALVSVYQSDNEELLARMQLYGNTDVTLLQAAAPRFSLSDSGNILRFDMTGGRLRLSVPEINGRPFSVIINTPQGVIAIGETGQYSLTANNEETQVAVQTGLARVSALGRYVDLIPEERSIIKTDSSPTPPLGTERNLIKNNDFTNGWDNWSQYAWEIERSNQPAGQISVVTKENEPVLYVIRQGEGHADVRVRQLIDVDVTDFKSLQLQVTFRIVGQSLGVCGVQGSECPLFVRVNYVDQAGLSRTWQHGFYASGTVTSQTPDTCAFCGVVQSPHELATLGQVQFYEVNLLDELARQGVSPASVIRSVELVVSGHSFEVEIDEVALLADE
jgi:hypothetical protein